MGDRNIVWIWVPVETNPDTGETEPDPTGSAFCCGLIILIVGAVAFDQGGGDGWIAAIVIGSLIIIGACAGEENGKPATEIEAGGPDTDVEKGGPEVAVETGGPEVAVATGGPEVEVETGGPQVEVETGGPEIVVATGGPETKTAVGGPKVKTDEI